MKANVKGVLMDAPATTENGHEVGWASAQAVLKAYGIPLRVDDCGCLLLGLRAFASALGQPLTYAAADNTVYIAARALPPLPDAAVGADIYCARPVTAPICGGPGDRRADLLERIIQQFRVAENPRYVKNQQGQDETYCNIFVWDVTRALGAEIPHWVVGDGNPSEVGTGRELDADSVNAWLRHRGPDFGWRPCDVGQALASANAGRPAVVSWLNPNGIGHVAMVRPGAADPDRGMPIAQAGGTNFDDGYLWDGFIRGTSPEFYVHG